MRRHGPRFLPIAVLLALAAACGGGPQPVHYGEDACAYCRMTVSDERFGATLMTAKGRSYAFDSIECLGAWALQEDALESARFVLVTAFDEPGTMLPAASASFVRSRRQQSPMGLGLMAFRTRAAARAAEPDEQPLAWNDVLEAVRRQRPRELRARAQDTVRGGE